MTFDQRKKDVLSKIDKSNKGSIDKPIISLLDKINKLDDYYTTSSCSGRIKLFVEPCSGRKCDSKTLFTSHAKVDNIDELWNIIKDFNNKKDSLWLKQEALILHVACKNTEAAKSFLDIAQKAGFKRAGIISLNNQPIVEIMGSERLETIVVKDSKILVEKGYFSTLLEEANKRFLINDKRIKKFKERII